MDIVVKSKAFAVRIVKLYNHLIVDKKEYVLSQQVLKCGTKIGANIHAAVCGQGTTDFAAKMRSSLSEASETEYWLELLRDTNYLTVEEAESILKDCVELIGILASITKIVTDNKQTTVSSSRQQMAINNKQTADSDKKATASRQQVAVSNKQTTIGKQQTTVGRIWKHVSRNG